MKKITFLLICFFAITVASAQLTSVALVGSGTEQGWPTDPQTDAHQMTSTDNVNWTISNIALKGGAIKFRGNNSWALPYNWGGTTFPTGTATIDGAGITATGGIYNVSLNSTTGVYNFQFVRHNISIFGDATPGAWVTDTDMSTTDNINYSINGVALITGSVKFRGNHSWDLPYNWGGTDFPSGTAVVNANGIVVPSSGTYNITFNINTAAYAFNSTLGVDDFESSDFKVFPNPTKDVINIKSNNIVSSLDLFDLTGKKVFSIKKLIDNRVSIGKLLSGIYIMHIKDSNNNSVFTKIVLE